MNFHSEFAAETGARIWRTDSFLPRFRIGEVGPWKINPGGQLINDWGYFSGPCLVEMLPSLSRRVKSSEGVEGDKWEVWMSLTPHEIESQELGFRHASGDTVIMGLGMGWIAANAALNDQVSSVTVIERDRDVIRLFRESGAFDSLAAPARQKINIVNADALEWCPASDQSVDFLYADIWLHLAEPETVGQMRRMQSNTSAKTIYFWGQEIAIHSAMSRISTDPNTRSSDPVRRAVNEVINLPLLIPENCDYAGMIQQVIENRVVRQRTIEVPID